MTIFYNTTYLNDSLRADGSKTSQSLVGNKSDKQSRGLQLNVLPSPLAIVLENFHFARAVEEFFNLFGLLSRVNN